MSYFCSVFGAIIAIIPFFVTINLPMHAFAMGKHTEYRYIGIVYTSLSTFYMSTVNKRDSLNIDTFFKYNILWLALYL